jgi:hypothetical protein
MSQAFDYKPGDEDKPDWLRPSDRHDHVEVVSAFATNGMETVWRHWEIRRGKGGKCVGLVEHTPDAECVSWLANLLNPEA